MPGREVPIRCRSNHYGIAVDATGTFRVRCKGKFCRGPEGTVSFHQIDLATGQMLRPELVNYRDPRELLGQGESTNDIR